MAHDMDEKMIPGSKIVRSANYRSSPTHPGAIGGGPRVGMPPSRIPEDDEFEFSISMTADMDEHEDLGQWSALGQHLRDSGYLKAADDTEGDRYLPPIDVAQTDREDEAGRGAGTPGRGIPLQDKYQHEKDVGVRSSSINTPAMKQHLERLKDQIVGCLEAAERAQRSGNVEASRVLDAKANKYASYAEALDQRIKMREDYETRVVR